MSQVTISTVHQAAWVGKPLVDPTISEWGDLIVLNNSSGASVNVAGIDDTQQIGEIRKVINRGTSDVVLKANDTAAPLKDRLKYEITLAPGKATLLLYDGTRWEYFTEV